MTRDDIIRVMRDVMRETVGGDEREWQVNEEMLEEWLPFLQAIAAAEREACAKVCDEYSADDCAAAIRARSKP